MKLILGAIIPSINSLSHVGENNLDELINAFFGDKEFLTQSDFQRFLRDYESLLYGKDKKRLSAVATAGSIRRRATIKITDDDNAESSIKRLRTVGRRGVKDVHVSHKKRSTIGVWTDWFATNRMEILIVLIFFLFNILMFVERFYSMCSINLFFFFYTFYN
jgi:hypothetical protein